MEDQKLSVAFERQEQFLIAKVTGENSLEASLSICEQVLSECNRLGLSKLLWIESMNRSLNFHEQEKLMLALGQMGFKEIKIACVDLVDQHMFDNSFGETVAKSRSLNLEVKSTVEEATCWLLED